VSQHNESSILVSFPYFITKGKVMVASHLGADPFVTCNKCSNSSLIFMKLGINIVSLQATPPCLKFLASLLQDGDPATL